jgi:hypothetical protein
MNTDIIQSQIGRIAVSDIEHIAVCVGSVKALGELYRETKRLLDGAMLEYADDHGSFEIGDTRYYSGFESDTICTDVPAALEALIEALGGDVRGLAQYLCTQPIKPGAARKLLPLEVYGKLFSTIEKKDLKTGKPARKVLAANTRFNKALEGSQL